MFKKFHKKFYSLIKTGLCSFAAILFSCTFIYIQEYNLVNALNKDNIGCTEYAGDESGYFAKCDTNPIHTHSLVAFLVLNEAENTEEDEVNEVSENKNKNFSSSFYYDANGTDNDKSLITQLALSILNRTSVALFILFHSWKSSLF